MEKLERRLREIYGERSWIIAIQAATAAGGWVERLASWDAPSLVVASNPGTGDPPDTDVVYTGSGGATAVDSIRQFSASVVSPSHEVQAAVDAFDIEGKAQVLAEPFATDQRMLGRKTFGVRRKEWAAWEDKMRADRLWEDLGIPHSPYEICSPAEGPAAAGRLATAQGTVWVADNSQGWHGGGEYVRWVADNREVGDIAQWFDERADQVRVMPFLDGLPCSIHGWVTDSGVAVFLPVEINILRHADRSGFAFAGVSTLWEPAESATAEMREVSRRVGSFLAQDVGYRGPYGIDGVLTGDGFRPTELNPRMSAGAGVQLGSVDVPLGALMRAEIEGLVEVDHSWLEAAALDQRRPVVHFGKMVTTEVRDSMFVSVDSAGAVVKADEGSSFGQVTAGPAATGSYIMGSFEPERLPKRGSVGWLVAGCLNLASREWSLGLPEYEPAPDLVT